MKKSKEMITGILAAVIVVAVVLLVLSTLPVRNTIEGNTLTTHFMLGTTSTIDIEGAVFQEVPEEAKSHLIRTNGTSLGKKHSGHFKNTKTGTKFIFQLTGKGQQYFFRKDGVNYVIDLEGNEGKGDGPAFPPLR